MHTVNINRHYKGQEKYVAPKLFRCYLVANMLQVRCYAPLFYLVLEVVPDLVYGLPCKFGDGGYLCVGKLLRKQMNEDISSVYRFFGVAMDHINLLYSRFF